MKFIKPFDQFVNEMKVNKFPSFKNLSVKDIQKNSEPHTHYNLSSIYYEKIGNFGLSIVGGTEKLDYSKMGADMKKLFSFLPPSRPGTFDRSPLMGDFENDFEIAISDWEGEDITHKFTQSPGYLNINQINKIRKELYDIEAKPHSVSDINTAFDNRVR